MLFDLHCHTSGISRCCKLPYTVIVDMTKDYGYDGIVLTNHYTQWNIAENPDEFVERYIAEYENARLYGEKVGLKVLFGAEITVSYNEAVHLLIYGVTAEFLRKNKDLPNLTQKRLYEVCHENGCVLVNAHPYRYGMTVQDVNYLDGVEINCHFKYDKCYADELTKIAKENGLALTCGCDFHGDAEKPYGGTYLPDNISNSIDLAKYIEACKVSNLKVHDPETREIYNLSVQTRV